MIGKLGTPPWKLTDDDLLCSKLLGDVAKFMVQASGLKMSFLDTYLDLLQDWRNEYSNSNILGVELHNSIYPQMQEEGLLHPYTGLEFPDLSDLEKDNTATDSDTSHEQL